VLEAALELFLERGYVATTVAAVAGRAGVAGDTVFHVFGSKRGLLTQVLDATIGGDDEPVAVLERAGPQAVRDEPDQRRQVALLARGMTAQLERVRPLDDVLRSAAAADPELAALRADVQLRQRRQAMSAVVGWIAARGALRQGATTGGAADEVWTLTSPEVHRLLRVDCGWTVEQYAEWLRRSLEGALLPP
jgi:AcrR family transcriptional regulator